MSYSPHTEANGSGSAQTDERGLYMPQPPLPQSPMALRASNGARQPIKAQHVMTNRSRERLVRFGILLLVTGIEALGIYLWLRWHHYGHPWRGNLALVVGESLETAAFKWALDKRPSERWGQLTPGTAADRHLKRMQRITGLAGIAEIGIWVMWLEAARRLGWPIAAGGLLVFMHVKHHVESVTVRDLPWRDGLFTIRNIFASAAEAAGAVGCLELLDHGHLWLAGATIGGGILIEHQAQLDALHWEMRARDIRLPRDRRWKPPPRRRPIELYAVTHFALGWRLLQRIKPLEWRVNRYLINEFILVVTPRPNRLSTKAPYTSWASLTDRSFSERHVPPVPERATRPATEPAGPPPTTDVAKLFQRPSRMVECPKSTVLFGLFAQWFTDGFLRTQRVPRNATVSESTNEVDLVQLYGRTPEQTLALRGSRGELKSQIIDDEEYPQYLCKRGVRKPKFDALSKPVGFDLILTEQKNRLFAMGSDVTNLGVVAFNTLFLREHNRIARRLSSEHPSWDSDRVFETARNTLTVVLLKIVIEEYVNHITPNHFRFRLTPGAFPNEPWYRSNWMAIEFNLLYRWHSLVPPTFDLNGKSLTLQETLWDTAVLTDTGLGSLMAAASNQAAGHIGLFNTDRFLVSRADQPSIEQARAARLASYNDYRRLCGLLPAASFEEISDDPVIQNALERTYADVEDVEFYTGLFAETTIPGGVLPPLMLSMVAFDAFSQVLTNPLLAPQIYNEQTFSETGWEIIQTTSTIAELVQRNSPCCFEERPVSFTRSDFRPTPAWWRSGWARDARARQRHA
jgi:prostaglandin-endoperoxide synthase 2